MQEIIEFLNRIHFFSNISRDFKIVLAEHLERREFARNEFIVREGDVGDSMFMIYSGLVAVVHEDPTLGIQLQLAQLLPGQVLGEMAILTRETRSASCKAVEATVAYELKSNVFISLLNRAPQVAVGVCQILASRVAELNRRQGIQILEPEKLVFDPEVYQLVPSQILKQYRVVPLHLEGNRLVVATPDPTNQLGLDAIRRCLPRTDLQPLMISEADYTRFCDRYLADPNKAALVQRKPGQKLPPVQFLSNPSDDGRDTMSTAAETTGVLSDIIAEALDRNSSDVHIEPTREGGVVRYRTDGQLVRREQLISRSLYRPLVSKLKVLATMDIAERRLPQDGRFGISLGNRVFDLRLSTLPTKVGEKVAIRILDTLSAMKPLEELILAGDVNKVVKRLVHHPYGTVIICGPTGGGKTTTMYAALGERKSGALNLTTIEDPIEYDLSDVVQVQVNEPVGLTFPVLLKTILRQDADVIMVGETRDAITAKMALEAGLAGHLVLTTLHANTALTAIIRLKELGADPFLLSNSINGIVCQRLVRRLCPACARATSDASAIHDVLVAEKILPAGFTGSLFMAVGCPTCRDTGYRGRVGVYEVLPMTDVLRTVLTTRDTTLDELQEAARQGGYVPMASYAGYLLRTGLTTPQEILRILNSNDNTR